jgi:hypothetical protein
MDPETKQAHAMRLARQRERFVDAQDAADGEDVRGIEPARTGTN